MREEGKAIDTRLARRYDDSIALHTLRGDGYASHG